MLVILYFSALGAVLGQQGTLTTDITPVSSTSIVALETTIDPVPAVTSDIALPTSSAEPLPTAVSEAPEPVPTVPPKVLPPINPSPKPAPVRPATSPVARVQQPAAPQTQNTENRRSSDEISSRNAVEAAPGTFEDGLEDTSVSVAALFPAETGMAALPISNQEVPQSKDNSEPESNDLADSVAAPFPMFTIAFIVFGVLLLVIAAVMYRRNGRKHPPMTPPKSRSPAIMELGDDSYAQEARTVSFATPPMEGSMPRVHTAPNISRFSIDSFMLKLVPDHYNRHSASAESIFSEASPAANNPNANVLAQLKINKYDRSPPSPNNRSEASLIMGVMGVPELHDADVEYDYPSQYSVARTSYTNDQLLPPSNAQQLGTFGYAGEGQDSWFVDGDLGANRNSTAQSEISESHNSAQDVNAPRESMNSFYSAYHHDPSHASYASN